MASLNIKHEELEREYFDIKLREGYIDMEKVHKELSF